MKSGRFKLLAATKPPPCLGSQMTQSGAEFPSRQERQVSRRCHGNGFNHRHATSFFSPFFHMRRVTNMDTDLLLLFNLRFPASIRMATVCFQSAPLDPQL